MESLRNVIVALQGEILAALAAEKDLPAGARLQADRVILDLSFSIRQQKTPDGAVVLRFGVLPSDRDNRPEPLSPERLHRLTVEFKVAATTLPGNKTADPGLHEPIAQPPARLDTAAADQLAESLVSIVGAPGFDSAARATVFREALAELSDEQARALSDGLQDLEAISSSPEVTHAGRLLSRLADTGPAGVGRGREVLANLLRQYSRQLLLRFAKEKWKTQQDWLHEPLPR